MRGASEKGVRALESWESIVKEEVLISKGVTPSQIEVQKYGATGSIPTYTTTF
jgi:hypothetical protein